MAPRAHLTYDDVGDCFFVTGYGLYIKDSEVRTDDHYTFIQALVKSRQLDQRIISRTSKLKAGYEYRKQFMADLLLPNFDPKNRVHVEVVETQEKLAVVARKLITMEGSGRTELEHRVTELEARIESLAAQLYGNPLTKAA
jgi:hypothetical protein